MGFINVMLVITLLGALEISEGFNLNPDVFGGPKFRARCKDPYCMECEEGFIMNPYARVFDRCVPSCPDGFYKAKHPRLGDICRRCRRNCKVCNDWLNCDVCSNGYALLETAFKRCVSKCPVNHVTTNTQKGLVCEIDKSGCVDESCTQCQQGYFHLQDWKSSHCVDRCPEGYFSSQEDGTLTCEKCLYNCEQCSSYMTCDRCYSGFSLIAQNSRFYCVKSSNA